MYYQGALELTPPGHPDRSSSLISLAIALKVRLVQEIASNPTIPSTTILDSRREVVDLLQTAASAISGGPPHIRLRASLYWVTTAVNWSNPSALQAYRVALELLETVVATGRSLESRHMRITSSQGPTTRTLALNGAACALEAGQIETAVEFLEQGRSVILTQAGKYRTRVNELRLIDADLAREFESTGRLMEGSVMSTVTQGAERLSNTGSDDAIARYLKLSEAWEAIINRIRCLKGFESFLRPTSFMILRAAAAHGPIILLNISERRSDGIILYSNTRPLVVPLPGATPQALAQMAAKANEKTQRNDFEELLKDTWERLVHPVVQTLQNDIQLPKGSRIWWCPTGAACRLPLHAAGIYNKRHRNLPSIYISSYTSTLLALIRAREGVPQILTTTPNLLVVGQANTPKQNPLPSVPLELMNVRSIVRSAAIITGSECTRETVLNAMARHTWTHIACHGSLDQDQPFRSHFSLQDGPITLLDIARQNLPNAELAFLATCHSAEGNIERPDEVLHLTAGLQFAGVRSVVGTLWAMYDDDGPVIAPSFYSNLVGDKGPAAESSAHALHRAVMELRTQKIGILKSRWACFVHYGC